MRKFIYISTLLLFVTLTISCSRHSKLPESTSLEKLLNENTDSLAHILEETIDPTFLSDSKKIDYTWWLTNLHEKQNRSLINDSLIQKVLEHDKETKAERLFKTYTLAADQANWANNTKLASEILNEATQLAIYKQDTAKILEFSYRLEEIYNKNNDTDKINHTINFIKNFRQKDESLDYYSNIVKLYSRIGVLDSIAKYSLIGIDIAKKEHKPEVEYTLTRAYVKYLNSTDQPTKALQTLHNFEHTYKNQNIYGNEIKFDYISTWIALNKYDSAQIYIKSFDKLLESTRLTEYATEGYLIGAILDQFSEIVNVKQNIAKKYNDGSSFNKILNATRDSQKNEAERLFAQHKLQTDQLKLKVEKGNLQKTILIVTISIVLVITILILSYQRRLIRKELKIKKIRNELLLKTEQIEENESKILENKQLISDLNTQLDEHEEVSKDINDLTIENEQLKQKNNTLQNEIETHTKSATSKDKELNYLQNLTRDNTKLKDQNQYLTMQLIRKTKTLADLSINPRYIELIQWIDILRAVDEIFENFSVRLHLDFPNLTEEDIRYCCLFKLQLTNSTISSLMGISPSSVTKRKQRIKDKMNQR